MLGPELLPILELNCNISLKQDFIIHVCLDLILDLDTKLLLNLGMKGKKQTSKKKTPKTLQTLEKIHQYGLINKSKEIEIIFFFLNL